MSRLDSGRIEKPTKRKNPSGETVWIARYTRPDGTRGIWKPAWNHHHGTFEKQYEAQRAILEAYEAHAKGRKDPQTVGGYFETWTSRRPRAERTNRTNEHRISRVLDVELEGKPLRAWMISDLRRRHAHDLIDHLLREQGRATSGAQNILRALSAMVEDAITDELAEVNFVRGVKVKATDPRCTKPRKQRRVWSFKEMHAFAKAAGRYEPLVRCFSDTGMRLGEVLPLRKMDFDGSVFRVARNAHDGHVTDVHGETKRHDRTVPCPPSLAELIEAGPTPLHVENLLFPTPRGCLWRERNFYRDVWHPTVEATGMTCTPHGFRHSYVSHLRAAGVDDADLAAVAGHTVGTMLGTYTHPLNRSYERIRELIG